MSAGWVAGNVRARLLLDRRVGAEAARELAACPSLDAALAGLAGTAYARAALARDDLEGAQREVAAATLQALRVLAGWLPVGTIELVRALGAWFELSNVEDRLAYLRDGDARPPFDLGALSAAWPRAAVAQTPAEVRDALRFSVWGDPGADDEGAIHLALRLAWARRVLDAVPEAAGWAAGAIALVLAREALLGSGTLARVGDRMLPGLGARWREGASVGALQAALPPRAGWALAGVDEPSGLWRAEASWWRRVEREATALVHGPIHAGGVAVGVVALLGLDAVRVRAALAAAAQGDRRGAREAVDALL
jgi:hypothetical protein